MKRAHLSTLPEIDPDVEAAKRVKQHRDAIVGVIDKSSLPMARNNGHDLAVNDDFLLFYKGMQDWHAQENCRRADKEAFARYIDSVFRRCNASVHSDKWKTAMKDFEGDIIYSAADAHELTVNLGRGAHDGALKSATMKDPLTRKYMLLIYDSWRFGTFLWGGTYDSIAKWWHTVCMLSR